MKLKINEDQLGYIQEQNSSPCQTPNAKFHIQVKDNSIECKIDLPMELELSEEQAKTLETNIHNSMEIILAQYFIKKD